MLLPSFLFSLPPSLPRPSLLSSPLCFPFLGRPRYTSRSRVFAHRARYVPAGEIGDRTRQQSKTKPAQPNSERRGRLAKLQELLPELSFLETPRAPKGNTQFLLLARVCM